jgi:hypothetical protein
MRYNSDEVAKAVTFSTAPEGKYEGTYLGSKPDDKDENVQFTFRIDKVLSTREALPAGMTPLDSDVTHYWWKPKPTDTEKSTKVRWGILKGMLEALGAQIDDAGWDDEACVGKRFAFEWYNDSYTGKDGKVKNKFVVRNIKAL